MIFRDSLPRNANGKVLKRELRGEFAELAPMTQKPAASASLAYRSYVLAVLVAAYTFNFIDRQIIGILAVPIKIELALDHYQLGLMGGLAFAMFYTLLGIPITRLADRVNRVRIMAVALALWSVMTAVCGLTTASPRCSWRAWASASARPAALRRPILCYATTFPAASAPGL